MVRQSGQKGLDSYTSIQTTIGGCLDEYVSLFSYHKNKTSQEAMASEIRNLTTIRGAIEMAYQQPLEDKDILDIGPGQLLKQSYFFAQTNSVTSLDYDVVVSGFDLSGYARMVTQNGVRRALKTMGRQLLGIDQKYHDGLRKYFNVRTLKKPSLVQGNASQMPFEDNHFDVVISFSAFEHIEDPKSALEEIKRTLRPGGIVYLGIHPFSSESGNHDPRIFSGHRDNVPYWAHLRPNSHHLTRTNAYCNKISIPEWKTMLAETWRGCSFEAFGSFEDTKVLTELRTLRGKNELASYTDDELLTDFLVGIWLKPQGLKITPDPQTSP